jgi:hypothetical protein
LHRRLGPGDDLEDAFAWKEERTLSRALTLQYDKILFILEPVEQAKAAIGKRALLRPDGTGLRLSRPIWCRRSCERPLPARPTICLRPVGGRLARPRASWLRTAQLMIEWDGQL